jgi:hypothetical protein
MELVLFTGSKTLAKFFARVSSLKGNVLTVFPVKEMKQNLKKIPSGSLVYCDLDSIPTKDRDKIIALVCARKNILAGFIDQKGVIRDPAMLFHKGAADYIGKGFTSASFDVKRVKTIMEFKPLFIESSGMSTTRLTIKPSGTDWKLIRPGTEYTFSMMFIELDRSNDIKRSVFGKGAANPIELFRTFVENHVARSNGRVWMWTDCCCLVLFPFDGKTCENALITGFRMYLDRKIYSIEESIFNTLISFRIAIHLGNTVYKKRGDTGTIVADSINSVFHIGQKFADEGSLYITDDANRFTPERLRDYLRSSGNFEGREIFRMRKPL